MTKKGSVEVAMKKTIEKSGNSNYQEGSHKMMQSNEKWRWYLGFLCHGIDFLISKAHSSHKIP